MPAASTGGRRHTCNHCGRQFQSYRSVKPYCSQDCYNQARHEAVPLIPCPVCGTTFRPRSVLKGKRRTYCSDGCKKIGQQASGHPNWTGGRGIDQHGYVRVRQPDGSYVREHRLVAEAQLGRPLAPHEHVHHRNHDKTDNRPENLEVLSAREHAELHGAEPRPRGPRMIECPRCGRTRKHRARGLCHSCYSYENQQARLAADPEGERAKMRARQRRQRARRRAA
jgi:endogenous inhibitor of DNA gyrase (YacG/DUF329 family)